MPQVLLSNRSAWLYHLDLRCWMCMADPAFAASPFTSLLPLNISQQGQSVLILCLFLCIGRQTCCSQTPNHFWLCTRKR